ncbi:MAG TPA: condensation domain-containing protein, partial [Blastocatellia bacterium]|nr:condensation domain-containing protein [Blastocatellia bacterium]
KDHQVKVRGYRVELEEVEAVLKRHPGVREGVVVAQNTERGDKRLIAYVVPHSELGVPVHDLRQFLRDRLPDYMVPSVISALPQFPLTPNGKVDRKALPDPESVSAEPACAYVAPRNQIESSMAGIWSEVLNVPRVGISDNFFDLGGHSLSATQVIYRLRDAFNVAIPLRDIFEHPTIERLSERVAERKVGQGEEKGVGDVPALAPVSRAEGLPLSFAQQRLWFLDQLEPGSPFYNVPTAVRLKGSLNVGVLERSLDEIIRRHEALRTTFAVVGGEPVQFVSPHSTLSLARVDLQELDDGRRLEEALGLARLEAGLPFELERGPLIRAVLIKMGESDHLLLVTLHHIVSDVWSRWVLMKEFARLYESFDEGKPSPLEELAIQYGDFAHWQRGWLAGEVLAEQLAFWREHLSGAPLVLDVPTGRPRPAVQSFRGDRYPIEISRELTESLLLLSRENGSTLFMTLMAAFSTLLYHYSGQDDMLIGVPIANRNRVEVEALIGFFVNTLVMRTRLSGDPTFIELLARVREEALQSYAHQDLPFERLVEEVQPERDLSRAPIFQVVFTLQNTPDSKLELPGLTLDSLEIDNGTSKYDLVLDLWETEEGIKGYWRYSTDLFEVETVRAISGRFDNLLRNIVASPRARLSEQNLLSDEEAMLLDRKIDIAGIEMSFSI